MAVDLSYYATAATVWYIAVVVIFLAVRKLAIYIAQFICSFPFTLQSFQLDHFDRRFLSSVSSQVPAFLSSFRFLMYVYICMCVCMCICVCVYIQLFLYVRVSSCWSIYTDTCVTPCFAPRIYCVYVCFLLLYVCMYICMCVCVCMYITYVCMYVRMFITFRCKDYNR